MNQEQHLPTLSTLDTPILVKHNFGTHTIKGNKIHAYTKSKESIFKIWNLITPTSN